MRFLPVGDGERRDPAAGEGGAEVRGTRIEMISSKTASYTVMLRSLMRPVFTSHCTYVRILSFREESSALAKIKAKAFTLLMEC